MGSTNPMLAQPARYDISYDEYAPQHDFLTLLLLLLYLRVGVWMSESK